MVTFVIEREKGEWQMRNEFNDNVKKRDTNLDSVLDWAVKYCAWQRCSLQFSAENTYEQDGLFHLAKRLGIETDR